MFKSKLGEIAEKCDDGDLPPLRPMLPSHKPQRGADAADAADADPTSLQTLLQTRNLTATDEFNRLLIGSIVGLNSTDVQQL